MFRTADFKISRPMFAVNLDAWSPGVPDGQGEGRAGSIPAVWFQRKRASVHGAWSLRTAACGGYLNRWIEGQAADGHDYMVRTARHDHSAYCVARWDGSTLWSLEGEESRARYLAVLKPMLAAYPEIPASFDGRWWAG